MFISIGEKFLGRRPLDVAEMHVAIMEAWEKIPPYWKQYVPDFKAVITNVSARIFYSFEPPSIREDVLVCSFERKADIPYILDKDRMMKQGAISFIFNFLRLFIRKNKGFKDVIQKEARNNKFVNLEGQPCSAKTIFLSFFPFRLLDQNEMVSQELALFLSRVDLSVQLGHLSLDREIFINRPIQRNRLFL